MRDGRGAGRNLYLCGGWNEIVIPATELVPLWGLGGRREFKWEEAESLSVLTGAWLFKGESAAPQEIEFAGLEWLPLEPVLRLEVLPDDGAWRLLDPRAAMRVPLWGKPLRRQLVRDGTRDNLQLAAERFDGAHNSLSLRVACAAGDFARLWRCDGDTASLRVKARALRPGTTAFELTLIERGGSAWGTNIQLTDEWRTAEIPVAELRLFTHWDADMAAKAGAHLRLEELVSLNICFGKWLFPAAAAEEHGFEIAEICLVR